MARSSLEISNGPIIHREKERNMYSFTAKYRGSTWNADILKTDQSNVLPGYKRCSRQLSPKCKRLKGVQPIASYRIMRNLVELQRPTTHAAACRWCESFLRQASAKKAKNIDAFREYQRTYKKNKAKDMSLKLTKGFQVVFDPTRMFPRNNIFRRNEFKKSLRACIWPTGMIVRDLKENIYLQIKMDEITEVADRDWFAYRREILNGEAPR
jgi:hypothetical protein